MACTCWWYLPTYRNASLPITGVKLVIGRPKVNFLTTLFFSINMFLESPICRNALLATTRVIGGLPKVKMSQKIYFSVNMYLAPPDVPKRVISYYGCYRQPLGRSVVEIVQKIYLSTNMFVVPPYVRKCVITDDACHRQLTGG
jgi:hypothetical protein